MSDTKAKAINIFTCDENRRYLHSVIPIKVDDESLQSMLNAFSSNYDSYISNTQEMWAIVRHLNRLFLQDVDFNPPTETTYSSGGEAIFMGEEINNGLNTEWNTCGDGASSYSGIPWADSQAGGYETRCPIQPNRAPCDGNNRFTWYRNKWMDKY